MSKHVGKIQKNSVTLATFAFNSTCFCKSMILHWRDFLNCLAYFIITRVSGGIFIKIDSKRVLTVGRILENKQARPVSREVVPGFTSTWGEIN